MHKKEIYLDTISGEELTKIAYEDHDTEYYNSKNQYHRVDGPAVDGVDGKAWFKNDMRHNPNGPAIERYTGYKAWYQNDRLYNLNGPAVVKANGDKEWWINDKQYTELEFNIIVRKLKMENL